MNENQRKYDFMKQRSKDHMDNYALSFGNKKITYREMHNNIEKYSNALYQRGIREGDVIGLCCLNTPESVYLLYALDNIGATVVGFNFLDTKDKVKKDIELTHPKMIITVDAFYNNFKDFEKSMNFDILLYSPVKSMNKIVKLVYNSKQLTKKNFTFNKNKYLSSIFKNNIKDKEYKKAEFHKGEVTDIIFTGGSTGMHKGVELSGEGLNHVITSMDPLFEIDPGMVHLGNVPFGPMVYGRMILHYALCNNMEYALTLKAMPEDFYSELVRTHADAAVGGPPHWVSLIEKVKDEFKPSSKLVKDSLPNLKYATSGGEAKKETTDKAIEEALRFCGSKANLGDGLGATEAWSAIMINNGTNTPGSLGKKLDCLDVKLVDPETGKEVEKGKPGLLYISGPSVMIGYHNNEEENKKVFKIDENGKKWVGTGDLIQELDNGDYKYIGRKKRIFVSGVDNIYPEQLEELLSEFPEVRESVVTPISDEIRQYIPRYHISLYNSNIDYDSFEKKLNKTVEKKLGKNWLPGFLDYTDEPLERMNNSKINIQYYMNKDKYDAEHDLLVANNKDMNKIKEK